MRAARLSSQTAYRGATLETRSAIFQMREGLEATGAINAETLEALGLYVAHDPIAMSAELNGD